MAPVVYASALLRDHPCKFRYKAFRWTMSGGIAVNAYAMMTEEPK